MRWVRVEGGLDSYHKHQTTLARVCLISTDRLPPLRHTSSGSPPNVCRLQGTAAHTQVDGGWHGCQNAGQPGVCVAVTLVRSAGGCSCAHSMPIERWSLVPTLSADAVLCLHTRRWRHPHGRAFEVTMCELRRRKAGVARGTKMAVDFKVRLPRCLGLTRARASHACTLRGTLLILPPLLPSCVPQACTLTCIPGEEAIQLR
jgi:hypothetical protein